MLAMEAAFCTDWITTCAHVFVCVLVVIIIIIMISIIIIIMC